MFRPMAVNLIKNYKSLEDQENYAWEQVGIALENRDPDKLKKSAFYILKLRKLKTINL